MNYREISADILSLPDTYWVAHCISQDCKLGKGLALSISNTYPNIRRYLVNQVRQDKTTIVIPYYTGEIFNLITKKEYFGKPTYKSIELALIELKYQVISMNIRKLAFPKIGCGLDNKDWNKVKQMILDIFEDVDNLDILFCYMDEEF